MEHNALVKQEQQLQMIPIAEAQNWYNAFVEFSKSILKSDLDYGIIPGTNKPTLLKAGAEKLRFAYGLGSEMETIDKTVDLSMPFVDYTYRCTIKSKQGQILAQCEGNCNSMEAKFGFLWVPKEEIAEGVDLTKLKVRTQGKKLQEFAFAIEKGETGGQYGKPAEYWQKWRDAVQAGTAKAIIKEARSGRKMDAFEIDEQVTQYRITNPDVVGMKNTIMKMAQKRAFVGAVLVATGASEFFTQDVEDMVINGVIYSDEHPEGETQKQPAAAANNQPEPNKATQDEEAALDLWRQSINGCKDQNELNRLYKSNSSVIEGNVKLQELMKARQTSFKKSTSKTA
jgi:hypothetical protein